MKQKFTLILGITFIVIHTAFTQNVGEIATNFTLNTLNDQFYTLSENRGDVIFVFLIGYDCPLCIAASPTVKSKILDVFNSKNNFQAIIIDTWDGSASQVMSFKDITKLSGTYLKVGSKVATSWSTTYNRVAVIDADGKMIFKGSRDPATDANDAATIIQSALDKITTAVGDISEGNKFSVAQNYPNPFSERTTINLYLPESENISLIVTDLTGKEILRRTGQIYPAGSNSIVFNRNNLSEGIYFYQLKAGQNTSTGKMIVQ